MTTEATPQNGIQRTNTEARQIRVVEDTSEFTNLLDTARFEHMYRVAQVFAASTLIPEHYQGNPGNCFIALQMATRLHVDPFMFMQKSYMIKGKPGIEAQLAVALINSSGLFTGALEYEIQGDDPENPFDDSYRARAFATRRDTGITLYGPWIDWKMVKAEGWFDKAGSKWQTMPEIMFRYRAASFFGRLNCPERLMGMHMADELEDMARPNFIEGGANTRLAAIMPALEPAKPAPAPTEAPPVVGTPPQIQPEAPTPPTTPATKRGRPGPKPAPTPEPPAPEPEPLPPEPAAPEPEAPGEVSKFLCYKTMPPEDVAPVDWLGFADAASLAEFYRKMDVGLRTTHWNCLTDDVRAIVAAACKPKTAAKPEPKPMVPESPATVIPAHAAAEGSQVDEYQEFVDSKSSSQLKAWFTRVTPDLLATGRQAAGVTNLSECNESQARKAAYAMRKAQGKK